VSDDFKPTPERLITEQQERCAMLLEDVSDRVRKGEISALVVALQTKSETGVEIMSSHPILAVAIHILSRAITGISDELLRKHYISNLNLKPEAPSEE
jgi:hypothetical protein